MLSTRESRKDIQKNHTNNCGYCMQNKSHHVHLAFDEGKMLLGNTSLLTSDIHCLVVHLNE